MITKLAFMGGWLILCALLSLAVDSLTNDKAVVFFQIIAAVSLVGCLTVIVKRQ